MTSNEFRLILAAPPERVFAALTEPDQIRQWRFPLDMTIQIHLYEPKEGGAFRVSLTYRDPSHAGKSSAHTDTYSGKIRRLLPPTELIEVLSFETTDPQMQGEMRIHSRLRAVEGGTELRIVHEGLPPGIRPEDNVIGWQLALERLKALVTPLSGASPSESFFRELPRLGTLSDMTSASAYQPLPSDWSLVMTDVRGSTEAIRQGRYKDVNVVGVCSIISVQNANKDLEFPFVFGGDGATLAVPPSALERTLSALNFTRDWSIEQFGLDLRIAAIPARDLLAAGFTLSVAKLAVSPESAIALFAGSGLAEGERLMKEEPDRYSRVQSGGRGVLQGLECRWNPVRSKAHGMLTLIVQSARDDENRFEIYREVLAGIQEIVPNLKPIRKDNLRASWPPKHLYAEARARYRTRLAQWAWLAAMMPVMGLLALVITLARRGQGNAVTGYLDSLTLNTDHIKFDDTLRMVLDVTEEQSRSLHQFLEGLHAEGRIYFGTHLSDEALMTCFIQSLSQHLHFVDGGSGGYAMAATKLKAQKKTPSRQEVPGPVSGRTKPTT